MTLVDRELIRRAAILDLPAAIEATRAWFRTSAASRSTPSATASSTAARTSTVRS